MRPAALSRSLPWFRLALMAVVTLGAAGCSSDSTRLNDRVFDSTGSRPSGELTSAVQPRTAPQTNPQINSAPLSPPPAAQTVAPLSAMTPPPAQRLAANPPPKSAATPVANPPAPPATNLPTHVVVSGDTLQKIARQYNVPVSDLAASNKIATSAKLKLGQQLVVPAAAPLKLAQAKPAPISKPNGTPPADRGPMIRNFTLTPELPAESKDTTQSGLMFRWPVRGRVLSGFGPKPSGLENAGINVSVPEGTQVKAAEDGVVVYANNELKPLGNLVLIRHNNNFVTAYAHCSEILVKKDELVKRGQVIAKSGQTGSVTSPQLHFEIRKGQVPVDPMPYLERGPQA